MLSFLLNRKLRNIKQLLMYPLWLMKPPGGADNHFFKRRRITRLQGKYQFRSFIETGTYYGQMTDAVKHLFTKVLTVELYQPLYEQNLAAFKNTNVKIFFGDSGSKLGEMIDEAGDSILFWLDGHYSGAGTALGEKVSPLIKELETIREKRLHKYCILIDDVRCFSPEHDYPELDEVMSVLKSLDPGIEISRDKDCLVAIKA